MGILIILVGKMKGKDAFKRSYLHAAWCIKNVQEVFTISQEAITVLDGGNGEHS